MRWARSAVTLEAFSCVSLSARSCVSRVIPVGIELTRKISGLALLDAVWAIPVAALAATTSLLFARGARGAIARTLERTGGSTTTRLARILAVAGICFTLSASIAVGLYELLLRLEH